MVDIRMLTHVIHGSSPNVYTVRTPKSMHTSIFKERKIYNMYIYIYMLSEDFLLFIILPIH